jgi:fructose-1,6-bisphosphatase/inositol monophosphatase family enzyme
MSEYGSGRRDYSDFVARLSPAMREAAEIAHSLEGRVENRPKESEATAVKQALTDADMATQEAILRVLLGSFPQVCLSAEEDTETVSRFPERSDARVIIDPIDGTLHSYLQAEGPYAVIVGLTLKGRYEAGLVALPREGLFFDAARGAGARAGSVGRPMSPIRVEPGGDRVLVHNGTPQSVVDRLNDRGWEIIRASGGAVSVAPLIPGVRAGLRCAASNDGISIRGRVGALISREAGAIVKGPGRTEFPDDADSPAPCLIVAGCSEDLEALEEAAAGACDA